MPPDNQCQWCGDRIARQHSTDRYCFTCKDFGRDLCKQMHYTAGGDEFFVPALLDQLALLIDLRIAKYNKDRGTGS